MHKLTLYVSSEYDNRKLDNPAVFVAPIVTFRKTEKELHKVLEFHKTNGVTYDGKKYEGYNIVSAQIDNKWIFISASVF